MRTNIILDDNIVKTAFRYSKAKTKKDLIHEALREFIQVKQKLNLRDLRGKIEFKQGYDYKKLRKGA
ncbi:MAG: hypothetical protein A2Z47_14690 [Thermodesulfovibrio sp. RBG_19FT_COMBO_42_12]|nr:MAG: hypothetical protein A2Z47_14690 [Thermodesulfovibrio sp. RBG_19FT_COMBO_42_12]